MRSSVALVILVAFASSATWASEPGQPLDCSDWVITEPGLTCRPWAPLGAVSDTSVFMARGSNLVVDNTGAMYALRHTWLPPGPPNEFGGLLELVRLRPGGVEEVLAHISARHSPNGTEDTIDPILSYYTTQAYVTYYSMQTHSILSFDPVNGRLLIPLGVGCTPSSSCPPAYGGVTIHAFEGFASLYEIQQSYTPPSSIGYHVPAMPEGMPAADHFDTYWGDLAPRVDFTQAHPLQCSYPASPPRVGDYLTVADPLPNPGAGQGRWYVTAATYQGATRYGRTMANGHLSGRDPALLPACVQP